MSNNKILSLSILALTLINILLYAKTADFEFVSYDDQRYVYENPLIQDIDGTKLKKIFSETYFGNYQPLVLLSYAANYKISKLDPRGYHITNIALHTINGILVLLLLFMMTKKPLISFIIALIFSVHPVQVESVAWISERKGLMCSLFYLLSFMSYIRYSRSDKKEFFILSVALLMFALLSKPMAIMFPFILILYDHYEERLTKRKLLEKIPFFLISGISVLVTILAQSSKAINEMRLPHVLKNFFFAFYTVAFYVGKLIAPMGLSAYYGYPKSISVFSSEIIISVIVIIGIVVYLCNFKRINRDVNFGVLFFLISLIPILRFVPLGDSFANDRYLYLPMIGLFFAIIMPLGTIAASKPVRTKIFTVALLLYALYFGSVTHSRSLVWASSGKLWSDIVSKNPSSFIALRGLVGSYYDAVLARGDLHTKERRYEKARGYYFMLLDYNAMIMKSREMNISEATFRQIFPHQIFLQMKQKALYRISLTYIYENDLSGAKKYLSMLVRQYPDNPDGLMQLGRVYEMGGDPVKAKEYYKRSAELSSKRD